MPIKNILRAEHYFGSGQEKVPIMHFFDATHHYDCWPVHSITRLNCHTAIHLMHAAHSLRS